MIEYVVGDATDPISKPAVIAHVCNDVGAWGAGFVLALSRRWKGPETAYRSRSILALGDVQFIDVGGGITVANMVAQRGCSGPRPWIRYNALEDCLRKVEAHASVACASIHCPRIGCGIAGGDWNSVEPILTRTCPNVRVVVYDLESNRP